MHEGWGPVLRFALLYTVGVDGLLYAAEERMTPAPKSKSGMPSGSGPYRWSANLESAKLYIIFTYTCARAETSFQAARPRIDTPPMRH